MKQKKQAVQISACFVVSQLMIKCDVFYRNQTHLGKAIKIELVIDNESRDLQLYNDSFLILIGRAEAGLRNS